MLKKLFGRATASPENPEGVPASGEVNAKKRRGGPKPAFAKARAKQRRLRRKSRS